MKSIYDFIYIDTNKIHSYYAQLEDGLPNQKKISNKDAKTRGGRGVIGSTQIALAEGLGSNTLEESFEEMMDMAHVLPRDMINLLDEHQLIAKKLGVNNLGKLVMVKGLIHMFDTYNFNKLATPILKITRKNLGDEEYLASLGDIDDDFLETIKEVVGSYPARIQANIQVYNGDKEKYAWMSLDENLFTAGYIDFTLKHDQASIEDFYVLGVLDSIPAQYANENQEKKRQALIEKVTGSMALGLFGSLSTKGVKSFMGRPDDFYGITPVCIFRKLDRPEA